MINKYIRIDSLLSRAFKSGLADDYSSFFQSLEEESLYFSIVNKGGDSFVPLVAVGESQRAVLFFLSPASRELGPNYGRIMWREALKMALNIPDSDGLIVQNSKQHWVAIDRVAIKALSTEGEWR